MSIDVQNGLLSSNSIAYQDEFNLKLIYPPKLWWSLAFDSL